MSRNKRRGGNKLLVKESHIRRFMKLANLQPLSEQFIDKITEKNEERPKGHARGRHEEDEGYTLEEGETEELEEAVSMKKLPDGGDPATKKGGGNGMAPWGSPPPKGKKGKSDLRKGDTAPAQEAVNEMAYKDDEPEGEEVEMELGAGEELGEPGEMEGDVGLGG